MTTPAWLAHYTTTSGNPDPRVAGRTARPRTCPGCGRLVLHGADHHRLAAYVSVDPYQATVVQEAAAILAGLYTYELAGEPPTWQLRYRVQPGVPLIAHLQRADNCRVVIEHTCARNLATEPLALRPSRLRSVSEEEIPF